MILVGSQRGGAGALARHLLNDRDNDHVEVLELRGFVSEDLEGALKEIQAVSLGTQCRQFLFSLSLNPPKDGGATLEDMMAAADQAEARLGLSGQPRALVCHEKEGRRHVHAVWSRIDVAEMKAIPLSFSHNKLMALGKELYLEHGWELPEGHRENGWKNPLNFTLAEWQQAKRLGLDPREIKQLFQDTWRYADGLRAFKAGLEDRGYFLAKGDRRGFVAVDIHGEVYSVARQIGIKTRELEARLGTPDGLPGVDAIKGDLATRLRAGLRRHLGMLRQEQSVEASHLKTELAALLEQQRAERAKLAVGLEARRQAENRDRQSRLRRGVRGLWDVLTGRAAALRRDNEREAFQAFKRDRDLREALFNAQLEERAGLQDRMARHRAQQRQERTAMSRQVARLLRLSPSLPSASLGRHLSRETPGLEP